MKLNKKGFTMVELLVVLLIIGVLAAVATPMYLANANRAKASEAVATMGMIRQAEREYFTKNNVYLGVTAGNLDKDTTNATPGLGMDVGIPQYFGNKCYYVNIGSATAAPASISNQFANPAAQHFVITVDGSGQTKGVDAINSDQVSKFKLEMDDSGRIFVTYNGTDWVAY